MATSRMRSALALSRCRSTTARRSGCVLTEASAPHFRSAQKRAPMCRSIRCRSLAVPVAWRRRWPCTVNSTPGSRYRSSGMVASTKQRARETVARPCATKRAPCLQAIMWQRCVGAAWHLWAQAARTPRTVTSIAGIHASPQRTRSCLSHCVPPAK